MTGIELATEWVTLLPETATLVKELKKFKPPPITVDLEVGKDARKAAQTIDKTLTKETKKTGEKVSQNIVPESDEVKKQAQKAGQTISREVLKPIQKVQNDIDRAIAPKADGKVKSAAQRVGQAIRKAVTDEAEKAGEESGNKIARGLERAKGQVAKAERSLADARLSAGNIESRIRQQEERIEQLRQATARGLKSVAAEEKSYQEMRANSTQHTADQIAAQERRMQAAQQAQSSRMVRLNAAEESQGRLMNSRQQAANRTAGAVENLGMREAALATALSMQNDPLDESNRGMKTGGVAAGGMLASLVPLGKQLLVTSGLFTGALGLGGAITYTLKTGNEFVDMMNRIQGITGATGDQLAAINAKARDLGRDFTLPATSANDAASAMLELTKAGFSVQQAMDAAKGSLQLSAAAGISAADAATITGTSLNAFGLQATDAAKVTDLLANAANLFPGEMSDFGYSLSQAGAVAKSFDINIEDTTTALGFLAKAGIKSSDAGTLIKTMLLSLTDQGKPAQAAIKELGLELYDQQGKFKGIEYVYKRLTEASKEMTKEQYQAATGTLFGTDAARFAGVAAGASAEEWDKMRAAMDRTGTAADVAAARLQGLPGAMEKLKNAGQSLALTIYDAVAKPLSDIVTWIAKVVLAFDDWLNSGFIQWIKDYKEELIGVGIVLGTYVSVLAAIKIATAAWTAVQWLLNAALDANPIGLAVIAIAALVAGVIYAYKHFEGFRNVVDTVGRALKDAWEKSWPTIKVALAAIGEGIMWLWHNVLVPLGNFLKDNFPKYLQFVGFMWQNVWLPVLKTVGAALQWLWNSVLVPAHQWLVAHWPEIKIAFAAAWEGIKQIFDTWKTTVLFIWNNVLKPWFSWLQAEWKVVWFAIQVGWEIGKQVFHDIAAVVTWLWKNVWSPAWDAIVAVVKTAWTIVQQALEGWKIALHVIGDAATWLWHTIFEPVWEGIKAGWDTLMKFLQPIFDIFKSGMEGIGTVASKIADGIRSAWSGLVDVFKAPLHALGSFLASIPGEIFGVEVPFISGIHDWGTKLQGLRTGGVIQGPGTGTSDSILGVNSRMVPTVRVSNGEGVVPADVMSTPLGQMIFSLLLSGVPGLKTGGRIGEFMSQADNARYQLGAFSLGAFDCSGLVSAMVNVSMGRAWNEGPPGGSPRTATGGEAAWLESQGFQKGSGGSDTLRVGFKNGGEGGGHTAGTLPDGTNFESTTGGVVFGSGASGAADFPIQYFLPRNGPDDPSMGSTPASGAFSLGGVYGGGAGSSSGGSGSSTKKVREAQDRVTDRTNQLALAQQRLDEFLTKQAAGETVKDSTIASARNQVSKFQRELDESKADLEEAKSSTGKAGKSADKSSSDTQWGDVGKMIFSGFLESFGLDGSVFTNLLDTPNVKSGMALLNFGLGLLAPQDSTNTTSDGGIDLGLGGSDGGAGALSAGADILAGIGEQAGVNMSPPAAADAAMAGGTPPAVFDMSGSQFGYSKDEIIGQADEKTASVSRRYPQIGPG
jgi:TP901 family phage tail tape measure protein